MTSAFQSLPAGSDVPLLIIGDHASRVIPARYQDLGLSGEDLTRHIAHDIGTDTVIRTLCARLGAAGHICGFSRLLIDVNREIGAAGLIPEASDGTQVSGNQTLAEMDRAVRLAEFYTPYHGALAEAVTKLRAAHDDPMLLSVHSFTPHPKTGTRREMDMALLVKDDTATAQAFMARAATAWPDFDIRINEPYSAYDLNHTIDVHARGVRHLAIEIRQDHIGTDDSAAKLAETLAGVITALL
jgi:predicted N-formylglutamate amidohydrolase